MFAVCCRVSGRLKKKIDRSELRFADPDVTEMPRVAELVYRSEDGNTETRTIVSFVDRVNPVAESSYECYSVPYNELNKP